jgi:hypothetical protein
VKQIIPKQEKLNRSSIALRITEFSNHAKTSVSIENKTLSLKTFFTTDNPPTDLIPLADFIGATQSLDGIPYTLVDYFELADWT